VSIATEILDIATNSDVMITTAESCTGGMLAAALTDLPGSSRIYDRGFVTYTNAAKTDMLNVSPDTLAAFGAVSEEVAGEMALGALSNSGAQIAVSVTGIAGPGGSEHKPEGRVCFGIAKAQLCQTETVEFGAIGRAAVRSAARDHAMALLRRAL